MHTGHVSDLVRKYFSAYERKDRKTIEDLLSDDFTFTGPLDDHIGRAIYFEKCWPYSERIRAVHIEKLFEGGNEAFIRYEIELKDGGRFRNVELFKVEGNKIGEVEVYFGSPTEDDSGEAQIRDLIDSWVKAVHAKDVSGRTASHAPDVVLFDVVNPLQYRGSDGARKRAQEWFSSFDGPLGYEIRDLSISAGDDVAFAHFLNRVNATRKDGKKIDMWWRATACFRKIEEKWTVTHEHASVPFDVETGQASLDLKP